MAVRIESQAEPIPGYRLIERLGGGGFGEVWKAEAPGGLFKAIKFVYGDLQGADEEGARAVQELKALSRVKDVHHPYILSLERVDIIDGRLIIVMELAHRTLWDRFKECRAAGLLGIPRNELLGYLEDSAEALDMMNGEYHLQHLDIKPQNLFLVHNHVKVADFGLVKDLEGVMASVTGGVTPVYAAPETFDGWVSRFSDQYSLGIVYQELSTGQRPFAGTTVRQLVMQHLQAQPDLAPLPPTDRPIVARALAKSPDDRYGSCVDFIRALRAASAADAAAASTAPAPEGTGPAAPRPQSTPREVLNTPDPPTERAGPLHRPPASEEARPPSAPGGAEPSPSFAANGHAEAGAAVSELATQARRPSRTPHLGPEGPLFVPALVVGLGGQGQAVLRQLRRQLQEHFGPGEPLPHLRLLCLDTDPDAIAGATRGDGSLSPAEVVLTRLQRASYYLRTRPRGAALEQWLAPRLLHRMPRQPLAAGIRALGRLAFVTNYPGIVKRLEADLRACCDRPAWEETARRTGLAVAPSPRVYVVTGLGGGTGGGMFIDLAYVLKHLLRQLSVERPELVAMLMVPGPGAPAGCLANSYASLTELHHFSDTAARFSARYSNGDPQETGTSFAENGPPFDRCLLLSSAIDGRPRAGPRENADPAAMAHAGRLLFADLCTCLGRANDAHRQAPHTEGWGPRLLYQTAGARWLVSPQKRILEQAGRRISRRLILHWMAKDARAVRDRAKKWAAKRWEELKLSADELISRVQEACEQSLGQPVETRLRELTAPVAALGAPRTKGDRNGALAVAEPACMTAAAVQALEQVGQLLGVPEECQPLAVPSAEAPPTGAVVELLEGVTSRLARECELALAQMIVRLIEEPAFRLAGAEETIRQLNALVEQALRNQEQLTAELEQRATNAYRRIQELVEPATQPSGQAGWKSPFARKAASGAAPGLAAELADLLRSYPKSRYQALVLRRINSFYVGLRGLLSDQLLEVDYCRARLGELATLVGGLPSAQAEEAPGLSLPPPEEGATYLLGEGCPDLEQALQRVEKAVSEEDLRALDARVQELVREQFHGLVQVCMTASNVLRALGPALCGVVVEFLQHKVPGSSAAEAFLADSAPDGGPITNKAAAFFEGAAAALAVHGSEKERCVLALAPGAAEDKLRGVVRQIAPDVRLESAPGPSDEVVLYRERSLLTPFDVALVAGPAKEAYERIRAQDPHGLHSRADITSW